MHTYTINIMKRALVVSLHKLKNL